MKPDEREHIITGPELFCDEHLQQCEDWELNLLTVVMTAQHKFLSMDRFFNIAYRLKNGYKPPDTAWGVDDEESNVPESERPEVQHINDTLREIQPVCCWMVEHAENPWPDEPAPDFIAILAHHQAEEIDEA